MTQVFFASEQSTEQLSALSDLLGLVYKGEGAPKFVLGARTLTQSARTQVPPLPRALVAKSEQD